MHPDVSFVVAAFNAAETVTRAIRSALAQTGAHVEVVVADDCSADGTVAVVEALDDPRVRLVRRAENGGPGAARNTALALARGRYLAVLDADDTVHPGRMERLVRRLDESGADAVLDNVEVSEPGLSGAGSPPRPMFPSRLLATPPRLDLAGYVGRNVVFRSTFNFGYLKPVLRRAFVERHDIRYPEDLRIGEDFVFMADALARGGTCLLEPSVGYTYGITKGSVSRVLRLDHVRAMQAADERFGARHALNGAARAAFALRARAFADAAAYIEMVDALKRRSVGAFARAALHRPAALRHFHMPVVKRLAALRALATRGETPT